MESPFLNQQAISILRKTQRSALAFRNLVWERRGVALNEEKRWPCDMARASLRHYLAARLTL